MSNCSWSNCVLFSWRNYLPIIQVNSKVLQNIYIGTSTSDVLSTVVQASNVINIHLWSLSLMVYLPQFDCPQIFTIFDVFVLLTPMVIDVNIKVNVLASHSKFILVERRARPNRFPLLLLVMIIMMMMR